LIDLGRYFVGNTRGGNSDSEFGIFDMNGAFIGIMIGKKCVEFSNLQITSSSETNLKELAGHPEAKIISAEVIYARLNIKDPNVS
jgi:hypothetical protein